jgi:hypothetical protein
MHVAADTIEALRVEVERLRAVLAAPVGEPHPYAYPPAEGEEAAGA